MTEKSVFREEVKFDAFGTSKHGEGKSLSKIFFATLTSTLGRFNRANKKKSVIYTLRSRFFLSDWTEYSIVHSCI